MVNHFPPFIGVALQQQEPLFKGRKKIGRKQVFQFWFPDPPVGLTYRPGSSDRRQPDQERKPTGRMREIDARPEAPPVMVHVLVEQGVGRFWTWLLAVLALAVIPVLVGLYHFWFERRRWQDSAYSPFHSGG